MSTKHVSLRMDTAVFGHLERLRRQFGRRRPGRIRRSVDEGVRMGKHRGIVFRLGPADLRATLVQGLDVWG